MKVYLKKDTECRCLIYDGDTRTVTVPRGWYHEYGHRDDGYRIRYDPDGHGQIDLLVRFADAASNL